MQMFIINGHDYTNNLVVPDYKVNQNDVYDEWEDGNRTKHRDISRTKVEGTLTLKFETAEEYDSFFTVLNANKNSAGYIPASLYAYNTGTLVASNYFIDSEPENNKPLAGTDEDEGITVTIEEI